MGILIFSHDTNRMEEFSRQLTANKYKVIKAFSPGALEKAFKEKHPEIIIIDSDPELCARLKSKIDNMCFFILLMPSARKQNIERIEKHYTDFYLEYPFSDAALISNINFLLNELKQKKHLQQVTDTIKENEEKFKRLFHLSPDGIGYHVGGKIGFINDAGMKILGAESIEAVFGKYILDFIHLLDKEAVFEKIKNIPAGKTNYLETRIITLDNKTKYIDIALTSFLLGGVNAVQFIFRDITDKKVNELELIESNAKLGFAQKISKLGYWELDILNNKLEWSKDIYKILGLPENEFQLTFNNLLNIIHPDDRMLFRKALDAALSGITPLDIEHRILKPDGQILCINQRGTVSYDQLGNITKFLGSIQDITERKNAENELKNSREQLRSLAAHLQNIREEERSSIAREIHDELGQVLTSLKMNLIFINKKITGSEIGINVNDLQNEIEGMTTVIDNTVKRIRKIITELRPEALDELGLIAALEWQAEEFKEKSGIDCKFINSFGNNEINKNISIAVYRISQEALTNVMRHSKANKVKITIGRTNNHLDLEIKDNGIGFEAKKDGESKSFGVLGMKERVIILGGDFKIEKVKPSGTKITVNIPLDIN